jgi:hypothetical protein
MTGDKFNFLHHDVEGKDSSWGRMENKRSLEKPPERLNGKISVYPNVMNGPLSQTDCFVRNNTGNGTREGKFEIMGELRETVMDDNLKRNSTYKYVPHSYAQDQRPVHKNIEITDRDRNFPSDRFNGIKQKQSKETFCPIFEEKGKHEFQPFGTGFHNSEYFSNLPDQNIGKVPQVNQTFHPFGAYHELPNNMEIYSSSRTK